MTGTHIVTVPIKFDNPPTSRGDVRALVGSLSGWNGLDPTVGSSDPTLFDLRLDVNAKSNDDAVKAARGILPFFLGGLKQYGPTVVEPIIAVTREDYLNASQPKTNDPIEVLKVELAKGDEARKTSQPGKADEPREGWRALFRIKDDKLPRELRGGEVICYQCMRQAFNDPPPKIMQPATDIPSGSKCTLCGADLRTAN